jgi:hypothetical protein
LPAIYYPSTFNPPGAVAAAPPAVPKGWDATGPAATRRQTPTQPDSAILPPGRFATTNTAQGRVAVAPETTRRQVPRQPDGPSWVPPVFGVAAAPSGWEAWRPNAIGFRGRAQPDGPAWAAGAFGTTNTTQGGQVFAPTATRKVWPVQPDGHTIPPGAFAGVTPFAVKGWEAMFPAVARRPAGQQPDALTWPAGRFTTTNTTQGGAAYYPDRTGGRSVRQPGPDPTPFARAAAAVVPQGWEAFAGRVLPPARRQQPDVGAVFVRVVPVPPVYGWWVVAPERTRGRPIWPWVDYDSRWLYGAPTTPSSPAYRPGDWPTIYVPRQVRAVPVPAQDRVVVAPARQVER